MRGGGVIGEGLAAALDGGGVDLARGVDALSESDDAHFAGEVDEFGVAVCVGGDFGDEEADRVSATVDGCDDVVGLRVRHSLLPCGVEVVGVSIDAEIGGRRPVLRDRRAAEVRVAIRS